jgi:hypothetical protein
MLGEAWGDNTMVFRFRKSFKILPGVKINLSKSGKSLSTGGQTLAKRV